MTDKVRIKTIVAVFLLLLLVISTFLLISRKENPNIYSRLATEEEKEKYTEYIYGDYSKSLFYNNSPVAVDIETSSIYLSVSEPSLKDDRIFVNLLYLSDMEDKELLFVLDEEHSDVSSCVSENLPFKLIVADVGSESYMEYNVFFSTLPIIRLEGGVVGKNDLRRPIYEGDFSIWDANSKDEELLKTSVAQWNIRGGSSTHYEKKSFKISLIKRNEENSMSLLDLGTDDEWILNAMVVDDTKIREKFVMDIWNQMQKTAANGVSMSIAEYVEVIINGHYQGLYLLQRQINEKYLGLNSDTVLLKGNDLWSPETVDEGYSIKYSVGMTDREIYDRMSGLFFMNDFSSLDINNWIDTNLLIQFGRMYDNRWLKNSYYLINYKNDEKIRIVLWDTDLSFGIDFGTSGFMYSFSPNVGVTREEFSSIMEILPETMNSMSERWKQLRTEVFNYDNLSSVIGIHNHQINSSGAIIRDNKANGLMHFGEDNCDNLLAYIQEQLKLMDELYLEKE